MGGGSDGSGRQWWIYIDPTVIISLIILVLGLYWAKSFFDDSHEQVRFHEQVSSIEESESIAAKRSEEAAQARIDEEARLSSEARERARAEQAREQARIELEKKLVREESDRKVEERRKDEEKRQAEVDAQKRRELERADSERREHEQQERNRFASIRDVAELRQILKTAERDYVEVTRQLDAARIKLLKCQQEIEDGTRQCQQLQRQITNILAVRGDVSNQVARVTAAYNVTASDVKIATFGVEQANADIAKYTALLSEPKTRRDQAAAALKALGAGATAPARIYVMRDGRRISVLSWVEAGDTVSVKLENGKFDALEKADIVKIEDVK